MKIQVTKHVNNHRFNNDYLVLVLEWDPLEDTNFQFLNGLLYGKKIMYVPFGTFFLGIFLRTRLTGHFQCFSQIKSLSAGARKEVNAGCRPILVSIFFTSYPNVIYTTLFHSLYR